MQRFLRRPLGTSELPEGMDSRIRRVEDYLSGVGAALAKLTNDSENQEVSAVPIPSPGVEFLDDLSDVDLSAPTTGEMLVYNGNDWANQNYTLADFGFGAAPSTDQRLYVQDDVSGTEQQRFYFTITSTTNSGLRGLHLEKKSTGATPVGLTLGYYDTAAPLWDTTAIDATTDDLVLAYSHTLKADNDRLRRDSAQRAMGRVVGQPASGGAQLQLEGGVGKTITGISNAVNAVITVATTLGFVIGDTVGIKGITAPAGMAAGINGTTATVTAVTATTITTTFDTSPYAAWSAGGTIYVATPGVTITCWDNPNGVLLLQGLPNTVTRRTKVQFGLSGPQMGSDAGQTGGNDWWLFIGSIFAMYGDSAGKMFIGGSGSTPTPTAKLHLGAGTATANTAPLKFTSGTNLTAVENGCFEYDGTELYFSRSSARLKVLLDTPVDGTNITMGTTTGLKLGTGTTQKLGFWNATPVARPAAYTVANPTTDRALDVTGDTLAQGLAVLGTLIADLQSIGLIG